MRIHVNKTWIQDGKYSIQIETQRIRNGNTTHPNTEQTLTQEEKNVKTIKIIMREKKTT